MLRNRCPVGPAALLVAALLLASCSASQSQTGTGPADSDRLQRGRTIYGDTCSVCHGSRGRGGVGPSLDDVVETWPDCEDQIEWISIGSEGWRSVHGGTYGATDRPVEGGMPAQQGELTDAEIRLAAAFERVEYGGEEPAAALEGCGAG